MLPKASSRRLNFISGEDFYFLAYSILLVLQFLGGPTQRVKDHRKLAYLVQFIADDRLLSILERSRDRPVVNPVDKEFLFHSFTRAELQKREVFKILFSLERRRLVALERTEVAELLDVTLNQKELPKDFFESGHFERERRNALQLKGLIPRLSALNHETLIARLYTQRGVNVWAA